MERDIDAGIKKSGPIGPLFWISQRYNGFSSMIPTSFYHPGHGRDGYERDGVLTKRFPAPASLRRPTERTDLSYRSF